jgi:hypothetical protein
LSPEAAHLTSRNDFLVTSFPSPCWRSSHLPKKTPDAWNISMSKSSFPCKYTIHRSMSRLPMGRLHPLSQSVANDRVHPDNASTAIGLVVRRPPPPQTSWENWLLMCLSNEACAVWLAGWMIRMMRVERKHMRWSEWRSSQ